MTLDAPKEKGNYEKRYSFLENHLFHDNNSNLSFIRLIPIQKCLGREHLQVHLDEIIGKGGYHYYYFLLMLLFNLFIFTNQ